jgi:hypothetical protein
MMEMNEAVAAGVAGIARVTVATEELARRGGGDNRRRQSGRVVAGEQLRTVGSINTNKALGAWVVIEVVSNAESRDLGAGREPFDMPQVIKAVARSCHGATIHMRA